MRWLSSKTRRGHLRLARITPRIVGWCVILAAAGLTGCSHAGPSRISFSQSDSSVEAYDYVEVTANVSWPHARNCFTDAALQGWFESTATGYRWKVEGFCDAEDGSVFRIRFMPPQAGDYKYFVEYRQGGSSRTSVGTFHASDGHRRGPIRVDRQYPWHFIWEGTHEHYFFNGTTAFWLMGWSDDKIIHASIERLHQLEVNRIRVTVAGRTKNFFWGTCHGGPELDSVHHAVARARSRGCIPSGF